MTFILYFDYYFESAEIASRGYGSTSTLRTWMFCDFENVILKIRHKKNLLSRNIEAKVSSFSFLIKNMQGHLISNLSVNNSTTNGKKRKTIIKAFQ